MRWKAFEQYAEEKERELWRAFVELDHDGDMRLRKDEVREACRRAGIDVREGAIDEFVRTVDRNGDGVISFDEWRDFLLVRSGILGTEFSLADPPASTAATPANVDEGDLAILAGEAVRAAIDEPADPGRRW